MSPPTMSIETFNLLRRKCSKELPPGIPLEEMGNQVTVVMDSKGDLRAIVSVGLTGTWDPTADEFESTPIQVVTQIVQSSAHIAEYGQMNSRMKAYMAHLLLQKVDIEVGARIYKTDKNEVVVVPRIELKGTRLQISFKEALTLREDGKPFTTEDWHDMMTFLQSRVEWVFAQSAFSPDTVQLVAFAIVNIMKRAEGNDWKSKMMAKPGHQAIHMESIG